MRSSGDARIEVRLDAGCRLGSLRVYGHELLVTSAADPIGWGCYPMAPYAGRVRNGVFTFGDRRYDLPRTMGGHAIHGTAYLRRWEEESDTSFVTDLGPDWPLAGWVRQVIDLDAESLRLRLEVHASKGAMPASCGWHPWFRREVGGTSASVDVLPGFMLERDDAGIATRRRCPPGDGPWDDCFGGVSSSPVIIWPGLLQLEMDSACDYWVVFTERSHAVCIEPQTAPPDALNQGDAFIVEPGNPLIAECTMRWRRPDRSPD